MNILLTGGAGYIASHAAVVITQAGHKVVLLDNFCNSNKDALDGMRRILHVGLPCIEGDVRNTGLVIELLHNYKIDAVVHFAGLKAVGDSVKNPIEYYANNVQGTISILEAMKSAKLKTFVFSSSATVYGDPNYLPIDEGHPTIPNSAYGRGKLHIEQILRDLANSEPSWKILCLRYFNPAGAHESGFIGEIPNNLPNNLMPYISQVASGELPYLNIYGDDYPTPDGTGVRDYIHVMDLAEGHLAALDFLHVNKGLHIFNLGTGKGVSVIEVIKAFEKATGKSIPFKIVPRRPGDVASCYAETSRAGYDLKWTPSRTLEDMCISGWNFQNIKRSI